MGHQRVTIDVRDQIATVSLNRSDKLNAFDLQMFLGVKNAIKTLRRDKNIRVVILRGEGPDFSTGLDVKSTMTNMSHAFKIFWKWIPIRANLAQIVSFGWRQLPIPVVCVIQGRCWGAGMQVALGTDYRIATPNAQLSIMESKWGLIPDMAGSLALRELLPLDKALKLTMTSEILSGEEALKYNLISEVANNPLARAQDIAKEIVQRSPDAISGAKRLYHYAWHNNDRRLLMREWIYQVRIIFGKNRTIAVKKQNGRDLEYLPRLNW